MRTYLRVAAMAAMLLCGYAAHGQAQQSGRFSWGTNLPVPREIVRGQMEERQEFRRGPLPNAIRNMRGKVLVFCLSCQTFAAYEDGVAAKRQGAVLSGRISSGRAGHRTPTGIFEVLYMREMHISSKYPKRPHPFPSGGAKMPHAVFFTHRGEAVHGGDVSSGFQSHGCIRLHPDTASFLWRHFYDRGMKIVVVRDRGHLAEVEQEFANVRR